ncbi:hypothetical protein H0I76_10005 [Limibaculum sp. M0105]|uniref:Uncharacterized protein n=1 Tax=Thermohalobaculum xanthum TaxID=2753746 RepID=A0A8J7M868_9RHOB|nr:hypothetical protein [Thermohalobaculum xanthum]MBK0399525.1 hypothetical protein [Thermohalobaculum xanthum]
MDAMHAILDRFPMRALEILRRSQRDPRLRSICGDYAEAASALRHWEGMAGDLHPTTREYRSFVGELENEILGRLDEPGD